MWQSFFLCMAVGVVTNTIIMAITGHGVFWHLFGWFP
jgi:hypothetical protein